VNVGHPTWSSTTLTVSRSAPTRSIVATKLPPPEPKSHEVRTIRLCGPAVRVARSPSSFERPYADSGLVWSDSTYGAAFEPSNT
jgi:hypothetical protein